MARQKQRENYGNGSISPVMVPKLAKDGSAVIGPDGKPARVQQHDKRGRPVWRVCVTLGTEEYTDKAGRKRKRQKKAPQKIFHGTLAEARAYAAKVSDEYSHIAKDAAGMTFSDAARAWEKSMRNSNKVAGQTLRGYVYQLAYMETQIGDTALLDIREQDIDNAIASLRADGNLGSTTINKVFAVTKRVFNFALKREWVMRNPLALMDSPRKSKVQTRFALSSEDAARLHAVLDDAEREALEDFAAKESRMVEWAHKRAHGGDKLWNRGQVRGISHLSCMTAIRVMLATGCRRGEVLALTWGAVDFEAGTIRITQSLTQKMEVKEPKSRAGVRTMAIDADTLAHLKAWKAYQASALQRVRVVNPDGSTSAARQADGTPVVCSDSGEWMDYNNLSRWWRGFRAAHGFDGLKLHELRHTAATLMLGNGADIKTVQTRLGHSTSSITLDFYAHAIPANDRAAADLMGRILGAPATPSVGVVKLPDLGKRTA